MSTSEIKKWTHYQEEWKEGRRVVCHGYEQVPYAETAGLGGEA